MPAEYQAILIGFFIACYFGHKSYKTLQKRKEAEVKIASTTKMIEAIESAASKGFEAVKDVAETISRNISQK